MLPPISKLKANAVGASSVLPGFAAVGGFPVRSLTVRHKENASERYVPPYRSLTSWKTTHRNTSLVRAEIIPETAPSTRPLKTLGPVTDDVFICPNGTRSGVTVVSLHVAKKGVGNVLPLTEI